MPFKRDDNGISIADCTGFSLVDATTIPQSSPIATGTTTITLTWPTTASNLIVFLPDAAATLVTVAAGTGANFPIPANCFFTVPRNAGLTYIKRDQGTTRIYFIFGTVA